MTHYEFKKKAIKGWGSKNRNKIVHSTKVYTTMNTIKHIKPFCSNDKAVVTVNRIIAKRGL